MSANDIVISGMSGRFPMSTNVEEFSKNLYAGIDMVTNTDDRWPTDIYGMCNRMGRIPDFDKFDGGYFGIMGNAAHILDIQQRLLLESTYEAIIDAGINPQSVRDTRTGVYVGVSSFSMIEGFLESVQPELRGRLNEMSHITFGNMKAIIANRISFCFDFKGPSMITDTACSASSTAFYFAINDFLLGRIDYAIVGGTHMTLEPFLLHLQQETGICSPRGISAVLDDSADGFVKADAAACLLLQRRSTAKRVYATVLSSRVNVDGKKTEGLFYPSSEAQEKLMVMSYKDAGIDPLKVTLIEAHCTGTKVGDLQEVKATYNAYCALPGRKATLPLGLLKSNTGHTEASSGICSLIKVILCYENESIPPNINLRNMKHECKEYCPPLYPNTEVLKYIPGLAAISNSGIGGANGHILIEPNYKLTNENNFKIAETIPRIVNICGRTEDAVRHVFNFIENNPQKISRDFLALLTETMKSVPDINSTGFPYRGSVIMKRMSADQSGVKYEYKKQMTEIKSKTLKPVWFLFPGLGGQWPAMAKALMPIKIFAEKVEDCHQILSEFKFDLKYLLLSEDKFAISTMTAKFSATTAIEIALFKVLKALEITPDGIIGHSFGEIACAYADGCLTTREAMIIAYVRGVVTESNTKIKGLMAVCALSSEEANKLIPPEVDIACYNAKNTVVLSGPEKPMNQIIENLKNKNIFVHRLESSGIPYHSKHIMSSAQPMITEIKKHLQEPKNRSTKWISTSIMEAEPKEEILRYASAEYFANNLISPVYFYDKLKGLPSDAIIIEIGPHGVFKKIVAETLEKSSYLSLIKKDSNDTNLDNFLSAIATLYEWGLNPSIENLYPKVEFPVSRSTPSIGSLMKWDHTNTYEFRRYPDYRNRSTASDMNMAIDLMQADDSFYSGHCINGSILFPATGFLLLAWRQFAASLGKTWNQVPVVFENVQFRRAVFLANENITKLKVRFEINSGNFFVFENENLCVTGKVSSPLDYPLLVQTIIHEKQNSLLLENEYSLDSEDIYKELRVMGYDYSVEFRRLKKIRTNDFQEIMGICEWNGNVVTYLDAFLQSLLFMGPFRKLQVPVMISSLRIDPKVLFDSIKDNRVDDSQETNIQYKDQDIGHHSWLPTVDTQTDPMIMRFCLFRANMPFYLNTTTNLLVAHGIEMENVLTSAIPRQTDSSNLVLDSYEFIANEDNCALEQCERIHAIEYLEVCKSMAAKLKQMGLKDLKLDFNYQNLSSDLLDDYRHQNNENHVMFKYFDKYYKLVEENQTFDLNMIKAFTDGLQNRTVFDLSKDLINKVSTNERLIRTLTDIVSENNVPKKELKVTEINLTSDLLMREVVQNMINFQVIPTNIDYHLVVESTEEVSENFRQIASVWNIKDELNIKASDLIIFKDTPELWELNLKELILKLVNSIKENGFLLIVAKSQLTEPEIMLKSVLSGQNIIKNTDLEKRIQEILKTTEELELNLICSKFDSIATKALLFRKVVEIKKIPAQEQIVEITSIRNENWFEFLKEKLIDAKLKDNKTDNVWLIARDTNINGIIGLLNCLRLEPGGENMRCIFDYDHSIKLPIDWKSKPFSDILRNDLVINVKRDGKLGTYRHLKLPKDYDKTLSNEYFLNVRQTRDLSSLQWFDSRSIVANEEIFDSNNKRVEQVPINIYSSGLNFRDIMFASGRVPSNTDFPLNDCVIGIEFAGRRADTGERVMGMEMTGRCFATSMKAKVNMMTPIPEHWSMDEAVTISSTYITIWYGLIERAGLKKGESILIHSGAGGVGQSAINVCKHYECDIFVTVGTEEKKLFLINEFNIPENRIFSSRDTQFKYKIKELTKGKGVNIVLNSLAGEKLDASYACLSKGGRFVELGKFDLVQNKQLGMFDFLKDISFIGVSIDVCLVNVPDFGIRFADWMHKNSNNGCIKPLNTIVFNASEAEKAFRYMTTGKHIGKIVLRIKEEEKVRKPLISKETAPQMLVTVKTYFDANKVYIITGGLGGFGIELVHWMFYMGARKFVLTSRSGLKTDYQKYVINRMIKFGENNHLFKVKIHISTNDCLTVESTRRVISDSLQFGQIGGIFHLTLILNDCLLEKLTYDKFCESIDTKYKVLNNLDVESRKLDYNLDYFVVTSSVTCGKGNNGQTNYAFGNSLCEHICEQRRKEGLHGLAIQYGPIGDVGVFENSDQVMAFSTLQKQRIHSCCDVLDKLLAIKQPIVTSHLKAELTHQNEDHKNRMIKTLWKVLGIDPEVTPDLLTLGEIGIESMFAVELQQELEREYNITISLIHLKSISVGILKEYETGKLENFQRYLENLRKASEILSSYKFIIPNETHNKLNDVKGGKPIYIFPPMEITFSAFEELAKKFDRPVIALNWTKHMNNFETIKDLFDYYSKLLKKLEPKGNYDLIGYMDGAFIVSKLILKGVVNKAVVIDVFPNGIFSDEGLFEKQLIEFIFDFFFKHFPEEFRDKAFHEIDTEIDLGSKIRRLVAKLKEIVGRGLIATDLEEIIRFMVKRLDIIDKYRTQKKNKFSNKLKERIDEKWAKKRGKMVFIKGFKTTEVDKDFESFRDVYLLPKQNEIIDFESVDIEDQISINSEEMSLKIINAFK